VANEQEGALMVMAVVESVAIDPMERGASGGDSPQAQLNGRVVLLGNAV